MARSGTQESHRETHGYSAYAAALNALSTAKKIQEIYIEEVARGVIRKAKGMLKQTQQY